MAAKLSHRTLVENLTLLLLFKVLMVATQPISVSFGSYVFTADQVNDNLHYLLNGWKKNFKICLHAVLQVHHSHLRRQQLNALRGRQLLELDPYHCISL